jgi:hypothetical protein
MRLRELHHYPRWLRTSFKQTVIPAKNTVIPAQAGIHRRTPVDSRLRGNDIIEGYFMPLSGVFIA